MECQLCGLGLRKHASTAPEWRRQALEQELVVARAEVARIEQELAALAAQQEELAPSEDEPAQMDMASLRKLVKEQGATPAGRKKADLIAARAA